LPIVYYRSIISNPNKKEKKMKKPDFVTNYQEKGVLTEDRGTGRKIIAWILIVSMAILAIAILVWVMIASTRTAPTYACAVDSLLGPQSVDLCSIVPEGVRSRSNVMVTTGFASYPGIVKLEGIDITYYNVLTAEDQLTDIVRTPAFVRSLQRISFYWVYLTGLGSFPVFYGIFKFVKFLTQKIRTSPKKRQSEFVRPDSDMKTLDLSVTSI
jgi:hypothetical protein